MRQPAIFVVLDALESELQRRLLRIQRGLFRIVGRLFRRRFQLAGQFRWLALGGRLQRRRRFDARRAVFLQFFERLCGR